MNGPDRSPFAAGQRVRVTAPNHPRVGQIGVVDAIDQHKGTVWLRVRFGPKATWDDWRQKGVIEDAWDLKADEVKAEGEGP